VVHLGGKNQFHLYVFLGLTPLASASTN
jgi:hypothetical protein